MINGKNANKKKFLSILCKKKYKFALKYYKEFLNKKYNYKFNYLIIEKLALFISWGVGNK
jgi:hypothetical protein